MAPEIAILYIPSSFDKKESLNYQILNHEEKKEFHSYLKNMKL